MTPDANPFTHALGLQDPRMVEEFEVDAQNKRIDVEIGFKPGSRFACSCCGAVDRPVHDVRRRTWEHLRFFEHKTFINASVPRVKCDACGKTAGAVVPRARKGSRFTSLFEAPVVSMAAVMPVKTMANLLDVGDMRLWRIIEHHVEKARALEDHGDASDVGVDETAARRGHDCITPFHDLSGGRPLFACEGRRGDTIGRFAADLRACGGDPEAVSSVCIDMSPAHISGVKRRLPDAEIIFDRFHVIQLGNEAASPESASGTWRTFGATFDDVRDGRGELPDSSRSGALLP